MSFTVIDHYEGFEKKAQPKILWNFFGTFFRTSELLNLFCSKKVQSAVNLRLNDLKPSEKKNKLEHFFLTLHI